MYKEGKEINADRHMQLLAAHLQQADPIMYDIVEKVSTQEKECDGAWVRGCAEADVVTNRRKSGKSSSST